MLDTLTLFGRYASGLQLTEKERDAARDMMLRSELGADDPTVLFFCILAKFDALSRTANGDIVTRGKQLIEGLDARVRKALEEKIASIPLSLSAEADKVFSERAEKIIEASFRRYDRSDYRLERFRYSALGLGFAILLVGSGAFLYSLGGDNKVSANQQVENTLSRSDASTTRMITENNDTRVVISSCGRTFERQGASYLGDCEIRTSKPLTSSAGSDALRLLWTEIQVKLGSVGLLASGVVLGALASWVVRKKSA